VQVIVDPAVLKTVFARFLCLERVVSTEISEAERSVTDSAAKNSWKLSAHLSASD
jgi:hypothetical protein